MGIDSLLKVLKSVTKKRHISEYKDKRVAIDTYCWLHKAIFLCAQELSEGKDTNEYINYCIKRVETLQKHNITVIMIFDGAKLPSKQSTEEEREKKRNENLQKHHQFKQQGDKEKAYQKLVESIDITTQMAQKLLDALQIRNVECIVAPYEADAQLAYLSITEYVDVIITEDSDLLAYGAKKVLFKLDKFGYGEEIEYNQIQNCTDYNFQNWSHQKFLTFCILSGCDYLESINGIGIKKAYQVVAMSQNYKQAIDNLQRKQKVSVPFDYIEAFEKAYLTFLFQRVFCPIQRKMVHVNSLDTEILYPQMKDLLDKNLDFLGANYSDQMIQEIADGKICPQDLKPYSQSSKSSKYINPNIKEQNINEELKFPTYGQSKQLQVFKLIKKSQNGTLNPEELNEKKDKIIEKNMNQGECNFFNDRNQSIFENKQFGDISEKELVQSNLFSTLNDQLEKNATQLSNNNILINKNKKKSSKIVIKQDQKKIDQFFQSKQKIVKTPNQSTDQAQLQNTIEHKTYKEEMKLEEEVGQKANRKKSEIEEEFSQYSISDEYSSKPKQIYFYSDFGNFLVEQMQFKKFELLK